MTSENNALDTEFLQKLKKMQESLSPFIAVANEIKRVALSFQPELTEISRTLNRVKSSWESRLNPLLEKLSLIAEAMKVLPDRMSDALLVMAEQGWFLDFEAYFSWPIEMADALNSGDLELAEKELVEHFRCRTKDIVNSVSMAYPNRALILEKALQAHLDGNYELAVPVLLAQADGICGELFGVEFFDRKRVEKVEALLKALDCKLTKASFAPLLKNTAIEWNRLDRNKNGNPAFNRNRIMHGDDVDYGTEKNSLKAISFLNYVATAYPAVVDNDDVAAPSPV